MINFGPIIFGFIIGLVVGIAIKDNPNSNIKFTASSFAVIFIIAIIFAWQLGQFPYYTDFPIATGFVSGVIGIFVGKFLFK
jgi:energy-converting hydrogenase B subunit J